jgi:hypothetical protein
MTDGRRVPVRLVFADRGSFHEMVVQLPVELLRRYDRLIDALREDVGITAEVFVDPRRLVAAFVEPATGAAD